MFLYKIYIHTNGRTMMRIQNGKMNPYQHILCCFGLLKYEFGKIIFNAPVISTFP